MCSISLETIEKKMTVKFDLQSTERVTLKSFYVEITFEKWEWNTFQTKAKKLHCQHICTTINAKQGSLGRNKTVEGNLEWHDGKQNDRNGKREMQNIFFSFQWSP